MSSEGHYTFINEENPDKKHMMRDAVSVFYDSSLPSHQVRDIVYPKNQFTNKKLVKPVMKHNIHNSKDFFVGHAREGQILRKGIYTAGVSHVYTKRNTFFYEVTANGKVIYEENVAVGLTFDNWVHHSVNYFNRTYMNHSDLFGEKLKNTNEVKVTFYGDKSRKEKLDEFKIKLVDPSGTNVSDASQDINSQKPSEEPNGSSNVSSETDTKSKYIVSLNAVPIDFNDDLGHPVGNGNGRTIVPVRIVSEKMGYDVDWDNTNRKVTITDNSTKIEFKIGENTAIVNGEKVPIDLREKEVDGKLTQIAADTKSKIIGGRTYVPLRFVSEAMGAKVDWVSHDGILFINIEKKQ